MFYFPDQNDYQFQQNNQSTQSNTQQNSNTFVDNEITCSICLSDEFNNDMCITNCKHIFHHSCLEKLNLRNIDNCPNCRNEDFIYLLLNTDKKQIEIFNTKTLIKNSINLFDVARQIIDENIQTIEGMLRNNINIKINHIKNNMINYHTELIKNEILENKLNELLDKRIERLVEQRVERLMEQQVERLVKQKYTEYFNSIQNTLREIDEKIDKFLDISIKEKLTETEKRLEEKIEEIIHKKYKDIFVKKKGCLF